MRPNYSQEGIFCFKMLFHTFYSRLESCPHSAKFLLFPKRVFCLFVNSIFVLFGIYRKIFEPHCSKILEEKKLTLPFNGYKIYFYNIILSEAFCVANNNNMVCLKHSRIISAKPSRYFSYQSNFIIQR